MVVLVTGGSGFIGKAFIKRYKKVMDIVAPSHDQMDITDARSVDSFFAGKKFDAVLHLAGLSEPGKHPLSEADVITMFNNIQHMSIRYGVRKLVVVNNGIGYATEKPLVDFTEDMFDEYVPAEGCGMGKYLVTRLAGKDNISTTLRLFGVYGAGAGQTAINKIVAAGSHGKAKIVIDRDMLVSGITLDDAVNVIGQFLLKDYPRGDYNVVAADKMSYVEIAKLVKRLVRKDGGNIDIAVKHSGDGAENTASNLKLVETTGIKIATMQSSIKKLYQELK